MTTQAQYLLDQIGTSPSVAFSLRLLKSTYSGPLVRIYVGTSYYDVYPDATTKNFSLSSKISAAIGSSSAGVAVASTNALSSIISAGTTNATVAIWYDQSGNDKYVHTSSTTGAPRIITAGSIRLMNGQPTINFIGAQTSPTPSALISVNTVNYSSQQTATVNAVVQNIGSTSNISGIYSTGISGGWGLNYDQTNGYWLDGNGCNQATTGGPSTTGKIVTEAERIKHSLANMGKNKNKPKPEGFGKLISFLTKGKLRGPRSKEHNINLAAARSIPILCYDLQGNLVKEYRSIVATEEDGFDASNVSANIKGRLKTCKKHIFKYK
jgi:hypothetical protein